MSSLAEDLRAVRALIDTPAKWGKGEGRDCPCLADAVQLVALPSGYPTEVDAVRRHAAIRTVLLNALPSGDHETLSEFNDRPATTHADIMALFDRAIASAESQP